MFFTFFLASYFARSAFSLTSLYQKTVNITSGINNIKLILRKKLFTKLLRKLVLCKNSIRTLNIMVKLCRNRDARAVFLMACDWSISTIIWFFISTWHFHAELLYKGKCQKWDSTNSLCNAFKYDDGSKSCELAKVSSTISILCIKVKPWIEIDNRFFYLNLLT